MSYISSLHKVQRKQLVWTTRSSAVADAACHWKCCC